METGHSDIRTTLIILGLHEFKNTHICMYQDMVQGRRFITKTVLNCYLYADLLIRTPDLNSKQI